LTLKTVDGPSKQSPPQAPTEDAGVLSAYFRHVYDARKALWTLVRRGLFRTAILHRISDQSVRVEQPFSLLRVLAAALLAALYAVSAALLYLLAPRLGIPLSPGFPAWALPLIGGLLGAASGLAGFRRSRFGVTRRVISDHSRWLLKGESVLLLQAPLHALRNPQIVIRESVETQPTVFLQFPKREEPAAGPPLETLLLSQDQLQQFARKLAREQRLLPKPGRNARLLRRAEEAAQTIHRICLDLADAGQLDQPITASAEWLLDNEYIIESNARDVRVNLPKRYFRELPVLERAPFEKLPRIYGLAKEFAARVDLRLDCESLLAFLNAYQSVQPLTIGELWALPQILRIALVESIRELGRRTLSDLQEREAAGFWANRLTSAGRRDPGQLFTVLAILIEERPAPSEYFCSQLINYLYDEANALTLVQNWLERTLAQPLAGLELREQSRQTKDQVSIGNAFSSLRILSHMDWTEVFEEVNRTEATLRRDPAGVYPRMDFETRDTYRRCIEEMARNSGGSELATAEAAVALAAAGAGQEPADDRLTHIGYYLLGGGRRELSRKLGCRRTFHCLLRDWTSARHPRLFLGSVAAAFAALYTPVLLLCLEEPSRFTGMLLAVLSAVPVSQIAVQAMNYIFTRVLPPRILPKMDFEKSGVPDEFRTLVVVPTLLTDSETIRSELEKIEIRYSGNPDANILFGVLSDFEDAETARCPEDAALLQQAVDGIRSLNGRCGGKCFFLFHREREWSPSEQCYIGRERKRGKLEELHQFLEGARPDDAPPFLREGNADRLAGIRFILTLDSDTHLPPGTARRLIGTLAHPLNQPRFDPQGRIMESTYTILQPRVSPSLPSTLASPFSRLFADPVGVDPYTRAVSDVYQDLTGEGSYNGKGIYDLRAFHKVLAGRFPEERLLSHDLIEGEHVRTALVSDIELFDEFPRTYFGYNLRQHRWIRGDWQIIDWLLPTVPLAGGRRGKNILTALSRWKIFDNLRRSLVPAAAVGMLICAWTASPAVAWVASAVAASIVFFNPLSLLLTALTSRGGTGSLSLSQVGHDILRSLAEASLLPQQAGTALDAILKVWYRRLVSHRGFLRWTAAQVVRRHTADKSGVFILFLFPYSLLSAAALYALFRWREPSAPAAVPWLGLWILTPLVVWILNTRPRRRPARVLLGESDRNFLRLVARRTWRFFADCIGEPTAWLPPDNYQVSHRNRLALRTSPTNIGLGLVSTLAARGFGYLTPDQTIERLSRMMETVSKLECYHGHLLNWYDLPSLRPLEPRYVSTVDSGNLLASLYALETGLDELLHRPILDGAVFRGLADTLGILRKAYALGKHPKRQGGTLQRLARDLADPPDRATGAVERIRRIGGEAADLSAAVLQEAGADSEAAVWAGRWSEETGAWVNLCDRYLQWAEILAAGLDRLSPPDREVLRNGLACAPSIADLAAGKVGALDAFLSIRSRGGLDPSAEEWAESVEEEFSKSKWLAGEMLGAADRTVKDCCRLRDGVDMRFLYDRERRLFSIGYNVTEGRLDPSYYDLLASESRLGSYVAVARGEAPVEHWFSLGRLFRGIGRRNVLISWTGTMFEYLMPLLFQKTYENSLLEKATRDAVDIQILYGRRRGIPWGLSESAFGDLDNNRTYQYKAFGVPILGLKRLAEEEMVVAPYATLLAVGIDPRAAVRNLRRLAGYGLLGEYGFYDAIDFSRTPARSSRPGINIRTFMTHHQSMSFLALANFLLGDPIRRYFHSHPVLQASELLLQERIPTAVPSHIPISRERGLLPLPGPEPAVREGRFDTPHTQRPRTQLLGHENYSVMVTNAGGGYSRWRKLDVTRWRSDPTRDNWGTFCYLRDASSGKIWSAAYHPAEGEVPSEYSALFSLDRALIRRRDGSIDTATEIFVSAEDDVEIRRMTLINRSLLPRTLELTSYVELAMAPHAADLQHPAFVKIFIQTEAVPPLRTLLAHRRRRSPDEPQMFVAHRWTLTQPSEEPMRFETDRGVFIGRGRTLADPLGLGRDPGNTQGTVVDPILSIRESVILEPGQRVQASMILAAGDTREKTLALAAKYGDPIAIERAADFSLAAAQIELRSLRVYPDDARQFQKLAGHLLYVNPLLRPSSEEVEKNTKGQSGLWPYGISGDLPILTATIGDERDLGLIRQTLQAHSYWRKRGFWADLLILNEEFGGYEKPLKEQLERIIHGYAIYTGVDTPGGIFLRNADQIPKDDLNLLKAASSVILVAARGGLSQQLGVRMETPELPEPIVKKRPGREPSALLPFMQLPYFNSLGGFTPDDREYAIYLGPNTHTPAPWINVLANPAFGAIVSESGSGPAWFGNSQRNRLTAWSNDPVLDPPAEAIYIRDEETGMFWTPTALPVREETAYRARHGAGYTIFEHNSHGIEQELTVLVPLNGAGGEPVKLQRLRLRNGSGRRRRLTVNYFVEWTLGEQRENSQMHTVTRWDDSTRTLTARNRYHPDFGSRVAFATLSPPPESYSGDRSSFIGRNRGLSNPAALDRIRRSQRAGARLDPCAAMQESLELDPGETREVLCLLGQADTLEEVRGIVERYREEAAFDSAMEETKARWDDLLGAIEIRTPELSTDLMVNRWLLYQAVGCRMWGRSALYQSGGAYGFRDQLQDSLALLYTHPDLTREQILRAAGRQFQEGDVQHWWHPPFGEGVRTRISDDPLWLAYAAAQYVRVTGDMAILEKDIPFLSAPPLEADQGESFSRPEVGPDQATLFEHCRRAVDLRLDFGPHGLPFMGSGDWDDSLNRVGAGGKGESVWLGWFLAEVLRGMIELSTATGRPELARDYRQKRAALLRNLEKHAWDGEWYLRAFFDDGTPLGTSADAQARIFSLPQSWARMCGDADPQRCAAAVESAWKHLVRGEAGLTLLFDPPFDSFQPFPGYIQGYPPGVRENGGQYTHAAVWLAIALARQGDGERAAQILRTLNPVERTRNPDQVWRYGLEPYAVAADISSAAGRVGRGGWSWYTGSAGWIYRAWTEEILGMRIRGGRLRIDPTIPAVWDGFRIRYRYGDGVYEIEVQNPEHVMHGVKAVEMDGQAVADGEIALSRELVLHKVTVKMGKT
jgi:cyclic beta-1,2-glucan synthetase